MTLQASWHTSDCHAAALHAGLDKLARQLGMEIKIRFTDPNRRQRFAIMVTKEPHCLEALMAAHQRHEIKADPVLVLGNRPDLAPLAKKFELPFVRVPWNDRARRGPCVASARRAWD
jgi:formyltetrahydrofolate deformylase